MTLGKLTIVPMLALALFAVGCGDDCVSHCEDRNACEGVERQDDCDKFCEDAQAEAEKAGCEDQWDDLVSCQADQEDVCKPSDACAKEVEAATECAQR